METKQEESNKNDKEEHIAFYQRDYIDSINEKLITVLLQDKGICSALSDLYIYYYFKHELSNVIPKEYENFIEYLSTKLGYDLKKLENVAKFINIIHSINNSADDIDGNAKTVMHMQHKDNKDFYQDLQKAVDKHKCLKLTFKGHDIVIVKNGDKYGYFNASEREAKNVSFKSLAKYVETMIQEHKLHNKYGNQVLCIHYGKERIEAIFKDKEGKRALRQLFDDTQPYLDHLDALKTEDDKVKDHVSKTKVRVEKFKEGEHISDTTSEAQKRNTNYKQSKAKLATFVTENETGEFDLTGYQAHGVVLILKDMLQRNNLSVKKLSLSRPQQLNINSIQLLEKIIQNNENIILDLYNNIYDQKKALLLIKDVNAYHIKYPTKAIKDVVYSIIRADCILFKQTKNINFSESSVEIVIDLLIERLPKEKKITKLHFCNRLSQQEYQLVPKIIKGRSITKLYFSESFQCSEELMRAIVENNSIEFIELWALQIIDESSIKMLQTILEKSPSINTVNLPCNDDITNNMFTGPFEAIIKNPKITNLNVQSNKFNDEEVAKLIEITKANNIKNLNIAEIKISNQAVEKLFQALKDNTSITNLNIEKINNMSNEKISKLLEKNQYSSVTIGRCYFKEGKGNKVFDAILKNKALHYFKLEWCEFDDQAKDAFIKALKSNTSIKSIKMYGKDEAFNKQVEDIIEKHNETPTPVTAQAQISNNNNETQIQYSN